MSEQPQQRVGSLGSRAARMQYALADLVERTKAQHGAERAEQTLSRARRAVDELTSLSSIIEDLRGFGIQTEPLGRSDAKSAGSGRTALRTASTKLRDAENDAVSVVTTRSVVEAIESAEQIVVRRSNAISRAFSAYRDRERPPGLSEVITDGIRSGTLAAKVERTRNSLLSDRAVQADEVLAECQRFESARRTWEELQPELEAARGEVSPGLQRFLSQARTGVRWQHLTPEVRAWLDEQGNGDGFVVMRRDSSF
jgi:hypothetical protein